MKDKIQILTWNIKNNTSNTFFEFLNLWLINNKIDILILQECLTGNTEKLVDYTELDYPKNGESLWVRIFIKNKSGIDYNKPTPLLYNKLLATEIYLNDNIIFSLFGVHFYSKIGRSTTQQNNLNKDFTLLIREIENIYGHKKSVIVGDFNYSPFETHLNNPVELNAINSKQLIRFFEKRKSGRFEYEFYYNPMWNLMGDFDYRIGKETVSGTYFWEANDAEKYYWNLFDGVLLNQSIMESIDLNDLKIISEDFIEYYNQNNTKQVMLKHSDHLPVKFSLKTNALNF